MTVVERILQISDDIQDKRTTEDVFTYMVTEVGELAMEISISSGFAKRNPDEDGIVGEAVDVIICAMDIIALQAPHLSEHDIEKIVQRKLDKWKQDYG